MDGLSAYNNGDEKNKLWHLKRIERVKIKYLKHLWIYQVGITPEFSVIKGGRSMQNDLINTSSPITFRKINSYLYFFFTLFGRPPTSILGTYICFMEEIKKKGPQTILVNQCSKEKKWYIPEEQFRAMIASDFP